MLEPVIVRHREVPGVAMAVEPMASFAWPTEGVPLAGLVGRVDDLAARVGVPVVAWDEDGLGPARGFGCRLPSGRLCFFEELDLAVQHQGARGPIVYVDAADLSSVGVTLLVFEVLAVLGLSESDLAGVAGPEARQAAAELAARVATAGAEKQAKA